MKTPLKRILCCTSLCLLTGAALGQADYGQPSSQPGSASGTQPSGSQPSGAMQPTTGQSQQFFHAKDLIGKEARDAQGNRLGKIEDVAFNPQNGETFAAIGVGIGRYALVPWQALTVSGTRGKEQVSLNTTKDALQSGPTVTSDQWQKLNDPSFAQSIYSHYGLQPPAAMGGAGAGAMGGTSTGAGAGAPGKPKAPPEQP